MRKRKLTRQIGVLLSDETYALLVEATDKTEETFSNFIRDIIEEKINLNKGEENNE